MFKSIKNRISTTFTNKNTEQAVHNTVVTVRKAGIATKNASIATKNATVSTSSAVKSGFLSGWNADISK